MNHCTGGEEAFGVDYLSYLEAWVDKGRTPGRMAPHYDICESIPGKPVARRDLRRNGNSIEV